MFEGYDWNRAFGEHVEDFNQSLKRYDTVLMGAKTYEFGFQYGLKPGEPSYQNMHHFIFSQTMKFSSSESVKLIDSNTLQVVERLKQQDGRDIWLCGGGELAGFLLEHGMLDKLTIKVNPVLFGAGRKLFGPCKIATKLKLTNSRYYNNGVVQSSYDLLSD